MNDDNYDEEAAIRYDAAVPSRPGEVDFYLELARQAQASGLPTLEPACGTGRIAIPLAREGINIVGLDSSASMLAVARERSAGLTTARWVEGDMRNFDLSERFGLAILPACSFQLLLTTEDQLACLECIAKHLEPGGWLAFEIDNPNIISMAEWLGVKRGTLQREPDHDYRHPESGLDVRSWRTYEYYPSVQKIVTEGAIDETDEDGRVVRRAYGQMELRYLHRFETEHLLARTGFEVQALYGDIDKREYGDDSPDMVWVASRRVAKSR